MVCSDLPSPTLATGETSCRMWYNWYAAGPRLGGGGRSGSCEFPSQVGGYKLPVDGNIGLADGGLGVNRKIDIFSSHCFRSKLSMSAAPTGDPSPPRMWTTSKAMIVPCHSGIC